MILFVLLWLLGKELLLWLCLDGYIILLVGPFGDIVFEFFDFYLGLIELVELGEDLVRKLGAILYSDYFFFVILGLLLLLIGCIIVSIWLKRRLRKGRGFVSKREGSSRDVFFGTR
jgi:NADH:ubiquinone oxidoreductase subunit 6 (subunit J)